MGIRSSSVPYGKQMEFLKDLKVVVNIGFMASVILVYFSFARKHVTLT